MPSECKKWYIRIDWITYDLFVQKQIPRYHKIDLNETEDWF